MKKVYNKNKDAGKMRILNCRIDWDVKSITKGANGNVIIEGFANTSDLDRVGDVVLPSAFSKSLEEYMSNPVLLFQHEWDDIVGSVLEAKVMDDEAGKSGGLWIKAQISNAPDTDSVRVKIREGSLRTFSIGYNEIDASYDKERDVYIVKELELLEISVVTIPANPNAKFTTVDAENIVNTQNERKVWSDDKFKELASALNQLDKTELLDKEFLKELFTIILEIKR